MANQNRLHGCKRRIVAAALLTVVCWHGIASAQRKQPTIKPKVFELGKKQPATKPAAGKSDAKTPANTASRGLTRGRGGFAMNSRRWALRLERLALNLDRASANAFARGLMPMRDYARQLETTEQLFTAAADMRKSKARKRYAVDAHARRLSEAAAKLKSLEQPAAKGAAAEMALAEFLTAFTRDRSIALRRGKGESVKSSAETNAAALKYFKQIKEDHSIGLADDRQLSEAAVFTALAIRNDSAKRTGAWATVAQAVAKRVKTLENIPGDRFAVTVAHLKAVEQFAAAQVASSGGRKSDVERLLLKSASHRVKEFQLLQARARTKTASLFELGRSWEQRRRLADSLPTVDKPTERALAADLQAMTKLANAVEDRRGRNTADVLFINALQELWRLPPGAASSSGNSIRRSRPRIQPQVIDLKPTRIPRR